jgi:acetyltransferase
MAAKALSALTRFNVLRSRTVTAPEKFRDIDLIRAQGIIRTAQSENRSMLSAVEVFGILDCYGIAAAKCAIAKSAAEAADIAEKLGFPVVVKVDSEKIIHKSDVGGVVLNLQDSGAVKAAVEGLIKKFGTNDVRFFVQQFLPGSPEIIVGAKAEPGLGHLVMFGLGGVLVELLKDVTFEITPVAAAEADDMVQSIKSYPVLAGYRGAPPVDRKKISEIIQRVSQLVTDIPSIREMDLNPITINKNGITVVDARILL